MIKESPTCPICCSGTFYDAKRDCYICFYCESLRCNERNIKQEKLNQKDANKLIKENKNLMNKKCTNLPPPYEERYSLK